jgi:hypothetical protein
MTAYQTNLSECNRGGETATPAERTRTVVFTLFRAHQISFANRTTRFAHRCLRMNKRSVH